MKIRLGTRGSELAVTQSRWVADQLRAARPDLEIEEVILRTTGDRDQLSPLHHHDTPGVFTGELERALRDEEIDLAVHSLKDLPTAVPEGTAIAAIPSREEPWDAWVSEAYPDPIDCPDGARIATGSLRRRAQLLHAHPHLEVVGIRGNIETRIARAAERGDAGVILAAAGLRRTGRHDRIRSTFTITEMTPAPGQGALALQVRDEEPWIAAVASIDDPVTRAEVTAERTFLATLEGGCHLPIGALARVRGDRLTLVGVVGIADGSRLLRLGAEGTAGEPEAAGDALASVILKSGGAEILAEILAQERAEPGRVSEDPTLKKSSGEPQ